MNKVTRLVYKTLKQLYKMKAVQGVSLSLTKTIKTTNSSKFNHETDFFHILIFLTFRILHLYF